MRKPAIAPQADQAPGRPKWRRTGRAIALTGLRAVLFVLIPLLWLHRLWTELALTLDCLRSERARLATRVAPGLGRFSTVDGKRWIGDVCGLQVLLITPGGPPTPSQARQVGAILRKLSVLTEKALGRLFTDDLNRLAPRRSVLVPWMLEIATGPRFALEFVHSNDDDAIYRVEFDGD